MGGSHWRMFRTIAAAERWGGISNLLLLLRQSLFGGAAADPINEACVDGLLRAGDAILMHPYLTHSSAWNYRPCLRLATHIQFNYRSPMSAEAWQEMGRRHAPRVPADPP